MNLAQLLRTRLLAALESLSIEIPDARRIQVNPAADLRFGDYQSNAAMMLAKAAKQNPRALAEQLVEKLEVEDLAEVSIAGPGFINFTIVPAAWAKVLQAQAASENLGITPVEKPRKIVLDFSAPNVAKPMHVGHIRSTILGECLGRISTALGHEVIKDNHVGDWGTQFGMVIWSWKNGVDEAALTADPLAELLRLYRAGSTAAKEDEATADACRAELVKLQQGDAENHAIWERCVDLSRAGLDAIYTRLDVSFDHWMGESHYDSALAPLTEKLESTGLARESQGALCVFSDENLPEKKDPFKIQRDGEWLDQPLIVRKKDGGFNYATTDLATVAHRVESWGADSIWYVVDFRQGQHFQQFFNVARRMGYTEVELEHIAFGTILGKDGKPLKTRAGDLPQLADVLDDAVKAAAKVVAEKSYLESEEEKAALAELIGVNSVKFTELSHHRMSDYTFDLEKMVALEGDTAPYLFYSYVRTRSIFRKLENPIEEEISYQKLAPTEPAEIQLARMLVRYGDTVKVVLDDFRPNLLATYLLETARAFHSFFEACPVLKAEPEVRASRLALTDLTSQVLKSGLNLLAIEVPERM